MSTRLRHLPVDMRAKQTDEPDAPAGVLVGYATVFDTEYPILYGLIESITAGAFDESLKERDGILPVFYEHDWREPIGYANAESDDRGVKVETTLFIDDVERSRAVWLGAKAGALREWSIGYLPTTIRIAKDEGERAEVEHIDKGELLEASVVVKGANPGTEMLNVRSIDIDRLAAAAADLLETRRQAAAPVIPDYLLGRLNEPHVRAIIRGALRPTTHLAQV